MTHQELYAQSGSAVCTVVGVQNRYASRRVMGLLEKFGEFSSKIH